MANATDPRTLTVLGQTLELRGSNAARAAWRFARDGYTINAYRFGTSYTVAVSASVDGHPVGIVKAEGPSLAVAARRVELEIRNR